MTDTDTTTQAGTIVVAGVTFQEGSLAAGVALRAAAEQELAAATTDTEKAVADAKLKALTDDGLVIDHVAVGATKVETALDTAKAEVAGDAKTIETDVTTEVDTLKADTTTDIEKAKASVQAAVEHIDNSGIVSSELIKAKTLLAHILTYIEAHI
jgi:Skp family chaperone for outer membrane proteins